MTPLDETEAFEARRLWMQPTLDNAMADLRGRVPGADADALFQALDQRADQIIDPRR